MKKTMKKTIKTLTCVLAMLMTSHLMAQTEVMIKAANLNSDDQKYLTKEGHISFFSEAPLEDIEAHNKSVTSIIDLEKSTLGAVVPIKEFQFEKSLMQEHFNENYLESDKYPKAKLSAKFSSEHPIDASKNEVHNVTINGKMTLHGVTKDFSTKGTLEVKNGQLMAKAKFNIALEDYKIKIPRIVIKNIAEVVEVTVDFKYQKYEGKGSQP